MSKTLFYCVFNNDTKIFARNRCLTVLFDDNVLKLQIRMFFLKGFLEIIYDTDQFVIDRKEGIYETK